MKILKKAKTNADLYTKYKYNYLKEGSMVSEDKCSRGCNRMLTVSEAKGPEKACYHCIKENTRDKLRCNGCDLVLPFLQADEEQLCGACKDYIDKTTSAAEKNVAKEKKTTTTTTSTPVHSYVDPCTHHNTPFVFQIGEGKVFAGGSKSSDDWTCLDQIDFILRLTGPPSELTGWNNAAEKMFGKDWLGSLCTPIPTVGISWSDMCAPPFGLKTVEKIVEQVKLGKSVLVHCVGGHGRTGTMLVAMAHVAGIIPEKDKKKPIHWLRKLYCEKAVESLAQREWLVAIGALPEVGTYSDYSHDTGPTYTSVYKWCKTHNTGLPHDCTPVTAPALTAQDIAQICDGNVTEEELIQMMLEGK